MIDRTIPRAAQRGARTVPVERARPKEIRGNVTLTPEELAIAMDMARADRIERDLAAYSIRKRTQ